MGTVTTTKKQTVFGDVNVDYGTVAMSDSYATGGDAQDVEPVLRSDTVIMSNHGDYSCEYLKATGEYFVRLISTGAEVANTTDLEAAGVIFKYIGIGGP